MLTIYKQNQVINDSLIGDISGMSAILSLKQQNVLEK